MANDPAKFQKLEFDELGDAIGVIKEAGRLTPLLMVTLMMEVIRKRFAVLEKAGHPIPVTHQKLASRQNAIELAEMKNDSELAEMVAPIVVTTEPVDGDVHTLPSWWAIKRQVRPGI